MFTQLFCAPFFSRKLRTLRILGFLWIISCSAYAQGVDALKAFMVNARSAQGTFTQTQFGSSGKVIAKTSGSFRFLRPGKFIWSTTKPYEQLLQSDGQKLYIWDKDLNQVSIRQLDNALASSPAAILFGSNAIEHHFKIKEAPLRDDVQWVELIPLTADTPFTQITIGFRGKVLAGMELKDTLGNATALIFGEVDTSKRLSERSFDFKIPSGADVIRN